MLKSASYVTDKHVQDLLVPMYNSVSACSTSAFVSCFIDEKYLHFLCTLCLFCLFSSAFRDSQSLAKQSFICLIYSKPNLFH